MIFLEPRRTLRARAGRLWAWGRLPLLAVRPSLPVEAEPVLHVRDVAGARTLGASYGDGPLLGVNSVAEAAGLGIGRSQVVASVGVVQQGDRLFGEPDGPGAVAEPRIRRRRQNPSEVVEGYRIVGLESDGFVVVVDCLVELALALQATPRLLKASA